MFKPTTTTTATYKITDAGRFGKALERTLDGRDKARTAGRVDWVYMRSRFEVKTGAGELGNLGERLVKGASQVLYVPVVHEDGLGEVDLHGQEGFILTREAFLDALTEAGALREKTSTAGVRKVTIQTFWNRKQDKPHGSLYYRLLDALYEHCTCTLEEFLEEAEA